MHALVFALALISSDAPGYPPAVPGAIVLADHHKPKHEAKAPATCCSGACCKCDGEINSLKARLEFTTAELANLKSGLPPKPYEPKAPAAVDRWAPHPTDGRYEIFGHEDAAGTFRYSQYRVKAGSFSSCPNGQCGYGAAPVRRGLFGRTR